jgi:hypothetical protein
MRRGTKICVSTLVSLLACASAVPAKDLGDILRDKGLITPEELRQAREEEKQKAAAEEQQKAAEGEAQSKSILAKLPKWLNYVTLFGDLRVRHENFSQNDLIARNRDRLRARVGLSVNPSDEISARVRLATGDPNNPVTRNQTFSNTFTQKPVNLDEAYLTLKPGKSFNLEPGWFTMTAGKFAANAYRVSELVWDDDLTPEGATETLNLVDQKEGFVRGLKVNAFQWVVDEIATQEDPWMGGGQLVGDTALGTAASWTLSFADYHYENLNAVAAKFLDPNSKNFNSQLANTNRLIVTRDASNKVTGVKGFTSKFNLVSAATELNLPDVGGIPAGVFGEFVYNTQADSKNVGFYVGAGIGYAGRDWYHNSLKNKGDWAVSYTYAWVERDAVVALFTYDDVFYYNHNTGSSPPTGPTGGTNIGAHIVRCDYMPLPGFQLTLKTHLINALDDHLNPSTTVFSPYKGNPTLVRTQLDAMLKF